MTEITLQENTLDIIGQLFNWTDSIKIGINQNGKDVSLDVFLISLGSSQGPSPRLPTGQKIYFHGRYIPLMFYHLYFTDITMDGNPESIRIYTNHKDKNTLYSSEKNGH